MNILYNTFGVLLVFLWNASVLIGTLWLILEKDWSPWTLVAALFFFSKWKEWTPEKVEEPKEEEPRIIFESTGNNSNYNYDGLEGRNH